MAKGAKRAALGVDVESVDLSEGVVSLIREAAVEAADAAYGEAGAPWGTSFSEIEEVSAKVGDLVARLTAAELLARQAGQKPPPTCPQCGGPVESTQEPVSILSKRGEVEWSQPRHACRKCRRSFFPSANGVGPLQ